jgi:hypothetical protein
MRWGQIEFAGSEEEAIAGRVALKVSGEANYASKAAELPVDSVPLGSGGADFGIGFASGHNEF